MVTSEDHIQASQPLEDQLQTNEQSLKSVLANLGDRGAHRVNLVERNEYGKRRQEDGEIQLEVSAIYGHCGVEARLRRFLETVNGPVEWDGREWSLDVTVGPEDPATDSTCVYDRTDDRLSGKGVRMMGLTPSTTD